MTFAATILTLYPEMFPGPLGHSIAGRALADAKWACETVQIRDFATDKHRTVDDTPAGGGAGMVLKCDVLARALDSAPAAGRPILAMTPRGKPITQQRIRELASGPGVIILCGRFEGFDELRANGVSSNGVVQRPRQHIALQHHPCPATSRGVIDSAVLVLGKIGRAHV